MTHLSHWSLMGCLLFTIGCWCANEERPIDLQCHEWERKWESEDVDIAGWVCKVTELPSTPTRPPEWIADGSPKHRDPQPSPWSLLADTAQRDGYAQHAPFDSSQHGSDSVAAPKVDEPGNETIEWTGFIRFRLSWAVLLNPQQGSAPVFVIFLGNLPTTANRMVFRWSRVFVSASRAIEWCLWVLFSFACSIQLVQQRIDVVDVWCCVVLDFFYSFPLFFCVDLLRRRWHACSVDIPGFFLLDRGGTDTFPAFQMRFSLRRLISGRCARLEAHDEVKPICRSLAGFIGTMASWTP